MQACMSTRPPSAAGTASARCRRGGTIYDLAAPLYFSGQSPEVLLRGERFNEVRERLMAMFFPGGAG